MEGQSKEIISKTKEMEREPREIVNQPKEIRRQKEMHPAPCHASF
jgi:hypothetical protein